MDHNHPDTYSKVIYSFRLVLTGSYKIIIIIKDNTNLHYTSTWISNVRSRGVCFVCIEFGYDERWLFKLSGFVFILWSFNYHGIIYLQRMYCLICSPCNPCVYSWIGAIIQNAIEWYILSNLPFTRSITNLSVLLMNKYFSCHFPQSHVQCKTCYCPQQ